VAAAIGILLDRQIPELRCRRRLYRALTRRIRFTCPPSARPSGGCRRWCIGCDDTAPVDLGVDSFAECRAQDQHALRRYGPFGSAFPHIGGVAQCCWRHAADNRQRPRLRERRASGRLIEHRTLQSPRPAGTGAVERRCRRRGSGSLCSDGRRPRKACNRPEYYRPIKHL
jgi:hypothetical protein